VPFTTAKFSIGGRFLKDLIDVISFLWGLGQPYILFSLSFMFAVAIISNIKDFIRKWR